MIEFMRADMDNDGKYTKIKMEARRIIRSKGLDFDEEFEKWKSERNL